MILFDFLRVRYYISIRKLLTEVDELLIEEGGGGMLTCGVIKTGTISLPNVEK